MNKYFADFAPIGLGVLMTTLVGCSRTGPTIHDIGIAERSNLKSASLSVEMFKNIKKRLPESLEEIKALYPDLVSFRSKDYWGNDLEYSRSDETFVLASKGPDSIMGTNDDIVLPNK